MRIQCNCGKFQAELVAFPKGTPGRLMCYCDDCQCYLIHLGRTDLLDPSGGTEIIPVYPADLTIVSGADQLTCTQLAPNHIYRFSTKCCKSPVGNIRPGTPWFGVQRNMYAAKDPRLLEKTLGKIRARIMGKFAKGPVPPGTPDKMNFSAALSVLPFMLNGKLRGKDKPSAFFKADGTPLVSPKVLSKAEREELRKRWEASGPYQPAQDA